MLVRPCASWARSQGFQGSRPGAGRAEASRAPASGARQSRPAAWAVMPSAAAAAAASFPAARGGGADAPAEVAQQVPAVGDLGGAGGALAGGLGVGAGPVPADHPRARVGL